ncbi:MAG: hypothetical protein M1834_009484 [Cirrosporium novae-zelandiae]|nr:MAG: hypothetical protein M1834_009484 [Cirrosporium novae-zelandiae]
MPVATFIAAALAVLHVSPAHAISAITAVGSKFFNADGSQFYIKGVAYQLTEDDPLSDTSQCELDAAQMADLGANTIRVYHVDPTNDHSGCMTAFANNSIYLFVDLDTFDTAIDQNKPSWTKSKLSAFEAVLDEFQQYNNTAGVFVGNEVLTFANGSSAAPYVKAAARDVKAYRDSKNYRKIPVGYSAEPADIADLRPMLQNYLACGDNSSEALDFFSLNAYEWCGSSSSYTVSGYSELEKNATGYDIPIFFSETGCNTARPRTFEDQASIFGSNMDGTWSGAIIYEWIEEANDYGLISYGSKTSASGALDGYPRSGTPTPISPDYSNLKSQWATLTPTGVQLSDYTASTSTLTPPECPSSTSGGWSVDPSSSLPTLGQTFIAETTATTTSGGSATASATASASKKGGASGRKEVAGMGIGLVAVMLTFVVWL